MLTSFGARTMTRLTCASPSVRTTPGATSASSRSYSSPISGETSSLSRTLPLTCTTQVTFSWVSNA